MEVQARNATQLESGLNTAMLIFVSQPVTAQDQEKTNGPASRSHPCGQRDFSDVHQSRVQEHVLAVEQMVEHHHHDDDALDGHAIVFG